MASQRSSGSIRYVLASTTILSWIALACIIASGIFWFHLHWLLIEPHSLAEAGIALGMGLVYTLVLPALWTMLIPSTPAGMLLQKTQLRTWGFAFVIGGAFFLTWHAATIFRIWWLSRPPVAQSGQDLALTIACLIAFIGVPALAWVQVTPEQWIAQVQQAHLVKKLEAMHAADIAAAKIAYYRALQTLSKGLANATVAERAETIQVFKALFSGMNDTLLAVAGTFREVAGVELAVPALDDTTIGYRCDEVAQLVEQAITVINDPPETMPRSEALGRVSNVAEERATSGQTSVVSWAARSDASGRIGAVTPSSTHDSLGASSGLLEQRETATLVAARAALDPGGWTARELCVALAIESSTAGKLIAAWREAGQIEALKLRGRYRFTEQEG
jgi:hypothetical protein